ncbi:ABC transporter substrate-binding protein [Phragmitibacter flavus]|uniref:ABC transporter substrate-binding protein n=1 Tax=Phragmitibacter flavus TaxID=2576071 RepID=A0A5R8KFM6_9BACT|nr:zinc ABC transporter substrate-binding protein [Phragmitibacter flavus]TLD71076.1 ABC transporter substrate-binding protein [Phragmitibacter flavus]
MKSLRFFVPAVLGLLLSACGPQSASTDTRLAVLTTTTMITDMVREVGGEDIALMPLMGAGVDPHLYKPSASDARKMREAKVVFYNGLLLEGRMGELFEQVRNDGGAVHELGATVPADKQLAADHDHPDPHIWFDPELWITCIDVVVNGLAAADAPHAENYRQRGADLKARYQAVFDRCKTLVNEIPASNRVLITSHDAFNYFGRAFGFEVVGVQGISTIAEAGLADVAKMVDFIKQRSVKAIFVESSVAHATIERISRDSGAKVGGELFSDALGTPGDTFQFEGTTYDKGTYEGALLYNVTTIVNALK